MATLRKPEHFWPALWAVVVLAFLAIIALEHFFGRVELGNDPRGAAKIVEARLLPAFRMPPEAQLAPETVARPLFAPGRRPAPPAATSGVPTMRKGQFVLTGVTVTPDEAFAFLKEVATGKTQSVKKGTQVNGITMDTIEPRRVVLKQGEETEELALNIQVPARVAAAAPAPAGSVPPAPGSAPAAQGAAATAPRPPGSVPPGPAPAAPTGVVPPGMAAAGGSSGVPAAPGATPAAAPAAAPQPAMPALPGPAPGRRRPWITSQ
jgi:hypothetical protein